MRQTAPAGFGGSSFGLALSGKEGEASGGSGDRWGGSRRAGFENIALRAKKVRVEGGLLGDKFASKPVEVWWAAGKGVKEVAKHNNT
jgi:hypothetical protein